MSAQITRALKKFYEQLVEVATRQFDTHVRETPVSSVTHENVPANSHSSSTRYRKSFFQSYVNAAKCNGHPFMAPGKSASQNPTENQYSKQKIDNRLFLRLPTDSPLYGKLPIVLDSGFLNGW